MDERWSDLVDAERSRQDERWGGYPHDSAHTEEDWNEMSDRDAKRARLTCWGDEQLLRWRSAWPLRGPRWRWWCIESVRCGRLYRGRWALGVDVLRQNADVWWLELWFTPWHVLSLELVNWA
jgi:hypothetical protein